MRWVCVIAVVGVLAGCAEPEPEQMNPEQMRSDTSFRLKLLRSQQAVPARGQVTYHFLAPNPVPKDTSEAFVKAVQAQGYGTFVENDRVIRVRSPRIPFEAKAISDRWIALTEIAEGYGYSSEGWSF